VSLRPSSTWLGAVGLAVSVGVGVVIAWGRVRSVTVPQPAHWTAPPAVCVSGDVDHAALRDALDAWRSHGHRILRSCDGRPGITVAVDPALDDAGPSGGDPGEHTATDEMGRPSRWGTTHVVALGDVMVSAEIRLHPHAGALTLAHELGHALGYLHPVAAPTGHLMHPSSPGWDWRGLEAP
jgi:hypothetical protein